MKTTHTTLYRVETKWPHNGRNGWRYLPEHSNVTRERANAILAEGKPFEREGMRQRLVVTETRVLFVSKSRKMGKRELEGLRNLRGY